MAWGMAVNKEVGVARAEVAGDEWRTARRCARGSGGHWARDSNIDLISES